MTKKIKLLGKPYSGGNFDIKSVDFEIEDFESGVVNCHMVHDFNGVRYCDTCNDTEEEISRTKKKLIELALIEVEEELKHFQAVQCKLNYLLGKEDK